VCPYQNCTKTRVNTNPRCRYFQDSQRLSRLPGRATKHAFCKWMRTIRAVAMMCAQATMRAVLNRIRSIPAGGTYTQAQKPGAARSASAHRPRPRDHRSPAPPTFQLARDCEIPRGWRRNSPPNPCRVVGPVGPNEESRPWHVEPATVCQKPTAAIPYECADQPKAWQETTMRSTKKGASDARRRYRECILHFGLPEWVVTITFERNGFDWVHAMKAVIRFLKEWEEQVRGEEIGVNPKTETTS
jgi:hypothetical protein